MWRKQKKKTQTAYPTVLAASGPPSTACKPWNEFLSVVVQSGLYAAPTLCLDERCVLMRAVREFNEARWEWACSYGRLLMWEVLRGFLLLCLYELDTFYGINAFMSWRPFMEIYIKESLHELKMICFPKGTCGAACNPDLNFFRMIFDLKDHNVDDNGLKISLSDNTIAPQWNSPDSSLVEKRAAFKGLPPASHIWSKEKLALLLPPFDIRTPHCKSWFLRVFISCFISSLMISVQNGKSENPPRAWKCVLNEVMPF